MTPAPSPACGEHADGFEPVARVFASQLASGVDLGASFTVYHRGVRVVHLWGGLASRERETPFEESTRALLFSVTKGLAAMGLHLLADRGKLAWDAPVTTLWPEFGAAGKQGVTLRELFGHQAGLPVLDRVFSLDETCDPAMRPAIARAIEQQRPLWQPGRGQGYHAITFGMLASEVFERAAGERLGAFLTRELFEPLGADVSLGTPASVDPRMATLYPPSTPARLAGMGKSVVRRAFGHDEPLTEWRVARALFSGGSIPRRAFLNPRVPHGLASYDHPSVWRSELAWASATGTSDGVARAYLPFSLGGEVAGRRYFSEASLSPLYERQGWAERDLVLQKSLGWSHGFLKEETHLFSPTRESFGHPGMGGSLGWCDPVKQLTLGYVKNKLDWHVRSPTALALCRALYDCAPLR
jgi:CubicO group peptidase (beta-lactamase class C family)